MSKNRVIVISREYASAGSEVGKILAAELGVPFYDKKLVGEQVKDAGLTEEFLKREDEKFINSLLFSLSTGTYHHANDKTMSDQVFIAESNAIKKLAAQGPCVIVGRCADYVLRDDADLFTVYFHADMDRRIQRCQEIAHLSARRAEQYVREKDRARARYYEYYTDRIWGDSKNYHLSLDLGRFGIEGAVRLILQAMGEE